MAPFILRLLGCVSGAHADGEAAHLKHQRRKSQGTAENKEEPGGLANQHSPWSSSDAGGPEQRQLGQLLHVQLCFTQHITWFERVSGACRHVLELVGAGACSIAVRDDARGWVVICAAGDGAAKPGTVLSSDCEPDVSASSAGDGQLTRRRPGGEASGKAVGRNRNSLQVVQAQQAPLMHSFHLRGGQGAPWDWQQLHQEHGFSDMLAVPLHCGGASMRGALTIAFRPGPGHGPGAAAAAPRTPASGHTSSTTSRSLTVATSPKAPPSAPAGSIARAPPSAMREAGAAPLELPPLCRDAHAVHMLGITVSMLVFCAGVPLAPGVAAAVADITAAASLQQLVLSVTQHAGQLLCASTKLPLTCNAAIWPSDMARALFFSEEAPPVPIATAFAAPATAATASGGSQPAPQLHAGQAPASGVAFGNQQLQQPSLGKLFAFNTLSSMLPAAAAPAHLSSLPEGNKGASRLRRSQQPQQADTTPAVSGSLFSSSAVLLEVPLQPAAATVQARSFALRNTLLPTLSAQNVIPDCAAFLQQVSVPKRDLYLMCSRSHTPPASLALAAASLPAAAAEPPPPAAAGSDAGGGSVRALVGGGPSPCSTCSPGHLHLRVQAANGSQPTATDGDDLNGYAAGASSSAAALALSLQQALGPPTASGGSGQLVLYALSHARLPRETLVAIQEEAQQLVSCFLAPAVAAKLAPGTPLAEELALLLEQTASASVRGGLSSRASAGAAAAPHGGPQLQLAADAVAAAAARAAQKPANAAGSSGALPKIGDGGHHGGSCDNNLMLTMASSITLDLAGGPPARPGSATALQDPHALLLLATGGGSSAAGGGRGTMLSTMHSISVPQAAEVHAAGTRTHMPMLVASFKDTLSLMQATRHLGQEVEDMSVLTLGPVLGRGGSGLVVHGKLHSALEVAVKLFENPNDTEEQPTGPTSTDCDGVTRDSTAAAAATGHNQARLQPPGRHATATDGGSTAAAGDDGGDAGAMSQVTKRHRDLLRNALELAVTSSISHPNIVQGYCHWVNAVLMQDAARKRCWLVSQEEYGLGAAEGAPAPPLCSVLVMEYCDAGTLLHAIARKAFKHAGVERSLNMEALLMCLLEVALALRHLHGANLAHCDIKPGNILLRSSPRDPRGFTCKVGDFGYVAMLKEGAVEGRATTMPQEACGTLQYMAPELFVSGQPVDASVDIYSFGLLMWELTSGKAPFHDCEYTSRQLMRAVYHGRRPQWADHVPAAYRQLAGSCWSGDPAKRPSAPQLVKLLRHRLEACRAAAGGVAAGVVVPASPAATTSAAAAEAPAPA